MDQNYAEQQSRQDQIIYSRIERVIAYKNVQFIIEHQNDTLEQLSAYLQSCMEDIGHPPAMVEVIGGEYIQYRFGTWTKALRSFYSGKMTNTKNPPPFKERKIVRDLYEVAQRRMAEKDTAGTSGEEPTGPVRRT